MKDANELLPTRQSLLSRLKDWNDQESWRVFFETYWRLIYNTALAAGLTEAEAQDVVQETVLSVAKSMPNFQYDSATGSFKSWLLKLTTWRIHDQFRKRDRGTNRSISPPRTREGTSTVERIPDPGSFPLETVWDSEWEKNLSEAAMNRVKRKVDPKHFQVFDLLVFKRWPVARVARALRVSPARVYLIKHRLGQLFKREIAYLRNKPL